MRFTKPPFYFTKSGFRFTGRVNAVGESNYIKQKNPALSKEGRIKTKFNTMKNYYCLTNVFVMVLPEVVVKRIK